MYKLLILFAFLFTNSIYLIAQKNIMSSVKPSDFKSVGIVKSFSDVKYLRNENEKNLEKELNTEISNISTKLMNEICEKYDIPHQNITLDSVTYNFYRNEITTIIDTITHTANIDIFKNRYNRSKVSKTIKSVVISDTICKIINSQNQRFAVSVGNLGFIRTYENKKKNSKYNFLIPATMIGGLVGALIAYGTIEPVTPYKTANYVLIIDSENKNIAYFQLFIGTSNPILETELKRMHYELFDNYWFWYDSEAQIYRKLKI